jgi:hypothetical protein
VNCSNPLNKENYNDSEICREQKEESDEQKVRLFQHRIAKRALFPRGRDLIRTFGFPVLHGEQRAGNIRRNLGSINIVRWRPSTGRARLMSDANLLSFGCVVTFIMIAGIYVYLREIADAADESEDQDL